MKNKVIDVCLSGKGYKDIPKGIQRTMAKGWNSEPSHEQPSCQNYSKSTLTTYPGVHKKTACKELQTSLASVQVSMHDSPIRQDKNGIYGHDPGQEGLDSCFLSLKTEIFQNLNFVFPQAVLI